MEHKRCYKIFLIRALLKKNITNYKLNIEFPNSKNNIRRKKWEKESKSGIFEIKNNGKNMKNEKKKRWRK